MAWGGSWGGWGAPIYGRRQGTGDVFAPAYQPGSPDYEAAKKATIGTAQTALPGMMDPVTNLLYQQHPEIAWAKLVSTEAPNSASHYARWLGDLFGEMNAGYANASIENKDLQFTDYANQQLPGLVQRYLGLPGWQQGKNPAPSSAGRYLNL